MALSSDDDLNGLTQSKFRANDEFGQSESSILRDIFQTESLLDLSVEEQSFLSENTSDCSVVERQSHPFFLSLSLLNLDLTKLSAKLRGLLKYHNLKIQAYPEDQLIFNEF